MLAVYILAGLVALGVVLGVALKLREGRAKSVTRQQSVGDLGIPLGETATLVQFSTEFCTKCPATRRALTALAGRHDGVAYADIDLTHDRATADRFRVLQTPTVLLADRSGLVLSRIGGAPRIPELEQAIADLR